MADQEQPEGISKKRSRLPLLIGIVLALAGGGGGFFAVKSGLLFADSAESEHAEGVKVSPLPDIAFVALEPLVINLGPQAGNQNLRLSAELEVEKSHEKEVASILPRVMDVLNGYLRAVNPNELEDPSALIRLRAQMLRRVQIVTGEGRVRDLLVMEFVLN